MRDKTRCVAGRAPRRAARRRRPGTTTTSRTLWPIDRRSDRSCTPAPGSLACPDRRTKRAIRGHGDSAARTAARRGTGHCGLWATRYGRSACPNGQGPGWSPGARRRSAPRARSRRGRGARPRPARTGPPPGRTLSGVLTKWRRVASIRPDRLCQLSGQSAVTARTGSRRADVGGGQHRRMARTEFPTKATHAQTRAHNASLVLRARLRPRPDQPRRDRPPHRPDPHLASGSSSRDLEHEGLAREVGRGPSTGGKQPTLVSLVDDARHVVTLDLGERTFTAALLDLRGEVSDRRDPRPRRPRRRRRPRRSSTT